MFETKPHLYGRRKGPKVGKHQADLMQNLLPSLRIDIDPEQPSEDINVQTLFEPSIADITSNLWLEIGFGDGEHFIWQAIQNPTIGFIGCEPFINGMGKCLEKIEQYDLQNIRLYDNDARFLLDRLPTASVSRVFILFPDPWPKKRHHKRRFIARDNLDRLARVMRPQAILRIASDIDSYLKSIMLGLTQHKAFIWCDETANAWRTRKPDWPQTRYERKALREGRKPAYLTFQRI